MKGKVVAWRIHWVRSSDQISKALSVSLSCFCETSCRAAFPEAPLCWGFGCPLPLSDGRDVSAHQSVVEVFNIILWRLNANTIVTTRLGRKGDIHFLSQNAILWIPTLRHNRWLVAMRRVHFCRSRTHTAHRHAAKRLSNLVQVLTNWWSSSLVYDQFEMSAFRSASWVAQRE